MPEEKTTKSILEGMEKVISDGAPVEELSKEEEVDNNYEEEKKEVVTEEEVEDVPHETSVEQEAEKINLTEDEKRALKKGWLPKNLYYDDDEKWWPADIYLARKERSEEINRLRRENKELSERLTSTRKITEENTISSLRAKKREAIQEADVDAVEEYDKQISKLEKELSKDLSKEDSIHQDVSMAGDEFASRNSSWFNEKNYKNSDMKKWTINRDKEMANSAEYGDMHVRDRLSLLEKEVKMRFSENFQNNNKRRAASVEGRTRQAPSGRKYNTLNPEVQNIMSQFDEMLGGKLDKDAYIKSLEKEGVL